MSTGVGPRVMTLPARLALEMLADGPVVHVGEPPQTWHALLRRGIVVEGEGGKFHITDRGRVALRARRW